MIDLISPGVPLAAASVLRLARGVRIAAAGPCFINLMRRRWAVLFCHEFQTAQNSPKSKNEPCMRHETRCRLSLLSCHFDSISDRSEFEFRIAVVVRGCQSQGKLVFVGTILLLENDVNRNVRSKATNTSSTRFTFEIEQGWS